MRHVEEAARCKECLLPDNPHFSLDAQGTCRLCTIAARSKPAVRPPALLAAELEQRIAAIKRAGHRRPFDCVVGLSGGRDSTYLLYLLTRKHGLRCLAAYYRTPFTSDVTDANVRRTVARLGQTLGEIRISTEEHARLAREMVLLWLERPTDRIVASMMCAPCKLVNRELFRMARANGVGAVVCGANPYEAVQIAVSIGEDTRTTAAEPPMRARIARSLAMAREGALALARSRRLLPYVPIGIQASLYVDPHTPYLRIRYPRVQPLEYFYYVPWRQEECEDALRALGWKLPPGCNSTWKSDCSFAEVKNVVFRRMTGLSYLDAFVANMVRTGAISRAEGQRRLAVEGGVSEERLLDVCRVLHLPPETFGLAGAVAHAPRGAAPGPEADASRGVG